MKIGTLPLVALLLAAGCAGGLKATRSYPAPSADELLQAVRARQANVHSMNVETRATSWLGGERVRGTVQMLVERGGQLRFEAEVALQGTIALLTVDHGQFAFIDHQKHLFRKGAACPGNVAELVRIPLAPAEVAAILLGDVLLPPGDDGKASIDWDSGRAADVLGAEMQSGTRVWLGLHRPNPQVAAWDVVFLEGQDSTRPQRWRVSYEDFERNAGIALPRLIRFAEPGQSFDDGVEIKIRERTANPSFPAGAFTLEPPPGYRVVEALCGAVR
jgi:hypothetical protein